MTWNKPISRAYDCPVRYIQGPDEFQNIFEYAAEYGDSFLFLMDAGIYDMMSEKIDAIPHGDCRCEKLLFEGESCMELVAELAEKAKTLGCNVLIGVGGGKVLDTAKLVGDEMDIPRIIVPTSASNDAPAANWAAIYTPEGVHIAGCRSRRATELVLVDSSIIVNAPARLFSAGIGDALATWYESDACDRSGAPNCVTKGFASCIASKAVCRECLEILFRDGVEALASVKRHELSDEVENVIEANVLLSGLGFINGGLAGAHGFHSGFSVPEGAERSLHGEKVAFGLLCQLVLEQAPEEEIRKVLRFLHDTDLPVTMEALGYPCSEENLERIAQHTVNKNKLIHHEPGDMTVERVKDAIRTADRIGREFLTE